MTPRDYVLALCASGLLLALFGSIAAFWHFRLKQACKLLVQAKPSWSGLGLDESVVTGMRQLRKRIDDFLRDVGFRE